MLICVCRCGKRFGAQITRVSLTFPIVLKLSMSGSDFWCGKGLVAELAWVSLTFPFVFPLLMFISVLPCGKRLVAELARVSWFGVFSLSVSISLDGLGKRAVAQFTSVPLNRMFEPSVLVLMISSGKTLKTEIAPITLLRHTLARHVGHWSKIDFFKQQRSRDFYKNRWLCGWIFIQIHVVVFFKLQITPVNFYTMKIKK